MLCHVKDMASSWEGQFRSIYRQMRAAQQQRDGILTDKTQRTGASEEVETPARPAPCPLLKCRMCRLTIGDPDTTRERLREVFDLMDKGWRSPQLAGSYGVSDSTVRDWKRAGLHRRQRGSL